MVTDNGILNRDAAKLVFHDDSVHRLNFRYTDKRRGIRPFIAPALLVTGGTVFQLLPDSKENINDFVHKQLSWDSHFDDYLQVAPLATVYLLNLAGIKGKNNLGNRTAIAAKSFVISSVITLMLKHSIDATRPNGEGRSFPSGHTTTAFTFAQFMHREYGEGSIWYSIGAYTAAGVTGISRMANNDHWLPDILAGAGIGMLSTELVYLTHHYKWDNEHIRRLDIFPFRTGRQNGLSLVYTF